MLTFTFRCLADFREQVLHDVITRLEPGLFKRVTGLEASYFDLLTPFGLFNVRLMNQVVFQFRRYEDSSLSYVGINKHEYEVVGMNSNSSKQRFKVSISTRKLWIRKNNSY